MLRVSAKISARLIPHSPHRYPEVATNSVPVLAQPFHADRNFFDIYAQRSGIDVDELIQQGTARLRCSDCPRWGEACQEQLAGPAERVSCETLPCISAFTYRLLSANSQLSNCDTPSSRSPEHGFTTVAGIPHRHSSTCAAPIRFIHGGLRAVAGPLGLC